MGVYAVLANLLGVGPEHRVERVIPAVCNIGFRPTLGGDEPEAPLVEVHLLDFDEDLYGTQVELEFLAHLRGEQRFSGLPELKQQIQRDIEQARRLFP